MQSYHHFTLKERICIAENLKNGYSIRKISKLLNRNPSSVSREIKRNSNTDGVYNFEYADNKAENNRKKSKKKRVLLYDIFLINFVIEKLNVFWSPEIISNVLKNSGITLSFSTIYKAINDNLLPKITAKTHLRRHGKKYRGNRHKYDTIHPEHTINERPVEANNRSELGHLEGDTILGSVGKGCVVTLVDRKSRYTVAKISKTKTKSDVGAALISALKEISKKFEIKTLTLDNGSEFADFKAIEEKMKITIYFAEPHSPWQRGSNENINDLYRFFYPKGTNFHKISDGDLKKTINLINKRPRKCFNFISPSDFL